MTSTTDIVTAGRRLAHALLKNTDHLPDIEFVDVVTRRSCNDIATESGFAIRTDGLNSVPDEKLADVIASRVFHAAAHMLCIQAGVSSHSGSSRHTKNFELALIELGCGEQGEMPKLNKSQQKAADDFMRVLKKQKRIRPATERTAYERATVVCPTEGCRHTLTLRKSAIAKTRFLCVEHGEEMSA